MGARRCSSGNDGPQRVLQPSCLQTDADGCHVVGYFSKVGPMAPLPASSASDCASNALPACGTVPSRPVEVSTETEPTDLLTSRCVPADSSLGLCFAWLSGRTAHLRTADRADALPLVPQSETLAYRPHSSPPKC